MVNNKVNKNGNNWPKPGPNHLCRNHGLNWVTMCYSGLTPIHQFVHIGDLAMIAGASALSQDIPPYCLAEGNRATIRGLNLIGLRRHVNREDINRLKMTYRELFESGSPLQETAHRLLQKENSKIVKKLLEFVTTSKRGIPFTRKNING